MPLPPDIVQSVSLAVERWLVSPLSAPLVITKTAEGAVCAVAAKQRFSAKEFAEQMGMTPNTWRKQVKEHLGLTPAHDGLYDAETIAWARGMLRQEESRATPHELRKQRRAA